LVQDRGGAEFQTAGNLLYVEDLKRGTHKDIGPKDIFEMASNLAPQSPGNHSNLYFCPAKAATNSPPTVPPNVEGWRFVTSRLELAFHLKRFQTNYGVRAQPFPNPVPARVHTDCQRDWNLKRLLI